VNRLRPSEEEVLALRKLLRLRAGGAISEGFADYPVDLNGEVHHDGQIWSRAL